MFPKSVANSPNFGVILPFLTNFAEIFPLSYLVDYFTLFSLRQSWDNFFIVIFPETDLHSQS